LAFKPEIGDLASSVASTVSVVSIDTRCASACGLLCGLSLKARKEGGGGIEVGSGSRSEAGAAWRLAFSTPADGGCRTLVAHLDFSGAGGCSGAARTAAGLVPRAHPRRCGRRAMLLGGRAVLLACDRLKARWADRDAIFRCPVCSHCPALWQGQKLDPQCDLDCGQTTVTWRQGG
jgi:hypothetical protein